jgi:hypothetical protein
MTAAAALAYREPTLRSFAALAGTSFLCTEQGVVPLGAEYAPPPPGTLGNEMGRVEIEDTADRHSDCSSGAYPT